MVNLNFALCLVIFLGTARTAYSVTCYVCDSVTYPGCDDPFDAANTNIPANATITGPIPTQECDRCYKWKEAKSGGGGVSRGCDVFTSYVSAEACGYIDSNGERSYRGTKVGESGGSWFGVRDWENGELWECYCEIDYCNAGAIVTASTLLVFSMLSFHCYQFSFLKHL
ncbi:uncharacterized protein LOC106174977 [Lingula anatina]|uniref:Uncharacterized protein LOC106174977 n=1 Tax=Lingula anatina TaxID=7574 RepID=A0A1S3JPC8_LINAN|nr:uncharacterized protein LOC106174977 [Lingula anatina]|eukprot:XP_013412220.1 uncharacterized protein LOC106174977 [Lingula anatina]